MNRAKALAKKLREVARELEEFGKDNPDLFTKKADTIRVRGKKNVGLYIDAQAIIKDWADRWKAEYKAEPVVNKSWTHLIVPLLKSKPKAEILQALDAYFRDSDKFVWQKNKSSLTYFVANINRYLPQTEAAQQYVDTAAMDRHGLE